MIKIIRFHSRINLTCVNHETGAVTPSRFYSSFGVGADDDLELACALVQVEARKFDMLANWQREYTMEDILTQLKKEMAAPHSRKLVQPPEGTFFE